MIPLSNTFGTVRKIGDDQQAFVCGALYPFMEHGTLAATEFETNIHAVYNEIFAKLKDDRHYQLYHIF